MIKFKPKFIYTLIGIFGILAFLINLAFNPLKSHPRFHESVFKSSYFQITNINLDLIADFKQKNLIGSATHTIQINVNLISSISFDIFELDVKSISLTNSNNTTINPIWNIQNIQIVTNLGIGQKLFIEVPRNFIPKPNKGKIFTVKILYEAPEKSSGNGTNWINPNQTDNNKNSMFYTNCYPSYCKEVLPTDESWTLTTNFSYTIKIPNNLKVWTSAILNKKFPYNSSYDQYEFSLSKNIRYTGFSLQIVIADMEKRLVQYKS